MFSYRIGEIKQSSVHAFQERAAAAFTSIGTLLSGEPALQDVPISLIIHAEFFYFALHVNCKGKQHLPTPSHTCFSRFCLLQKRVTLKLPSKLVKRNSLEKVQVVSSSLFRFNNGKEKWVLFVYILFTVAQFYFLIYTKFEVFIAYNLKDVLCVHLWNILLHFLVQIFGWLC